MTFTDEQIERILQGEVVFLTRKGTSTKVKLKRVGQDIAIYCFEVQYNGPAKWYRVGINFCNRLAIDVFAESASFWQIQQ
jgi:hypothetical protein